MAGRSAGSVGGGDGASQIVPAESAGDSVAIDTPDASEGAIWSNEDGDSPQSTTSTAQATAGNALIDAARVLTRPRARASRVYAGSASLAKAERLRSLREPRIDS